MGEVIDRHNKIIHPGDRVGGEATFVGLEHVEANTGRRIGSTTIDLGRLTGRKPTFKKGQIVYGYLRPYLNKVWIAEFDGCSSVDQFAFEVRREQADPEFIAAYMRSDVFLRRSSIVTTTGQLPRISIDEILAVPIELPPLAEQQRIAGILRQQLAAVELARASAEAQLKAAQALPAAYLRDILVAAESEGWPIKRLGGLLQRIEAGKCLSCEERPAKSNEWGVLRVSAVTWGAFRPEENKVLPPHFEVPAELEVKKGDFLISRSNTTELVGAVVHVRETRPRLMLSDKTLRLVARQQELLPEYLELALRSPACRAFIEEKATGASSSMKNITQDTIRDIPLPIPPIEVQRQIMERVTRQLDKIEPIRRAINDNLGALDAFPAALLRAAFQGRI